jgi:hypothetical protein
MYGLIIRAAVFFGLIRILFIAKSPILCASIYTFIAVFFSLIYGMDFLTLILTGGLSFGLSWLYYWLLLRYQGYLIFWIILIAGIVILFL